MLNAKQGQVEIPRYTDRRVTPIDPMHGTVKDGSQGSNCIPSDPLTLSTTASAASGSMSQGCTTAAAYGGDSVVCGVLAAGYYARLALNVAVKPDAPQAVRRCFEYWDFIYPKESR